MVYFDVKNQPMKNSAIIYWNEMKIRKIKKKHQLMEKKIKMEWKTWKDVWLMRITIMKKIIIIMKEIIIFFVIVAKIKMEIVQLEEFLLSDLSRQQMKCGLNRMTILNNRNI
ncbi:MAG: hypothetical protein EZS28_000703 [Streblomastix strix]|uniref:Uncharacterized protein n=1 Tax=Streblomastix strix TaxID=222440 RepID=A0A5J4XB81_9EUKA|nr:MAG: hypothetical protein EZS28_000703 [Streblomastix strix]